jgi:putative heme-binding domain-containing protein
MDRTISQGLRFAVILAGAIVAPYPQQPLAAAEDWADARNPVTDGLELWLDASRQEAPRRERKLPSLEDGALLSAWFDASGKGRHLTQSHRSSQPRIRVGRADSGDVAAVVFDGEDDYLEVRTEPLALTEYTLFIVAAPRSNAGFFRAFLAASRVGQNDYTSGFTVDLGPAATPSWSVLNVEGPGYGGALDLLRDDQPLGDSFHVLCATAGAGAVALFLDALPQETRQRDAVPMTLEQLTVGARIYCNSGEPPFASGFLQGAIAEVILYRRSLGAADRAAVTEYLRRKHGRLIGAVSLDEAVSGFSTNDGSVRVVPVPPGKPGGPPIQVLFPGFEVDTLPVHLTNVNNLRYRSADGARPPVLVALTYDGRILLLTDSDGDGLEDRATAFWDRQTLRAPIGMALTPRGSPSGFGAYVASKGKVSLVLDTDGDDVGDREVIVAQGWTELQHGVDSLGVALAPSGEVYFGLGCANFTNAYLIDAATGKAGYRLNSERGTILRVAPDFSSRRIVCTGIRFPVALGFNRHGDLFATDQEGETWLPNGNPRDELLQILPGRHYGFPPRDARHLPNVIDEPSVYDYGPQHQSTCGLAFNEAVGPGGAFGPSHFAGDAFVAGYSRGKVYRTRLHRLDGEPPLYLARTSIFAALGLLAVETCISPRGDLILAAHSGGPDWGSGPLGEGTLLRVRYARRELPQPAAVWAESPIETRIAFDRPLAAGQLEDLSFEIIYGEQVRAGDRFEVLRPGYEAVKEQQRAERRRLAVEGAALSADRRTILLRTRPHPFRSHFALQVASKSGQLDTELDYDLCGAEAVWTRAPAPKSGTPAQSPTAAAVAAWSGWLPHFDPGACATFLSGAPRGDDLARVLATPGQLTVRARIDLPPGPHEISARGSAPFQLRVGAAAGASERSPAGGHELKLRANPDDGPIVLELRLETGSSPSFSITTRRDGEPYDRAISAQRLVPPWVAEPPALRLAAGDKAGSALQDAEVTGNWLRGREVYFGEGKCSNCHRIRGEGRDVGPDLSNLVHRDAESVLRDITQPSFAINPDHVGYTVLLRTGEVLTGLLHSSPDGSIHIFDIEGKETVVAPKDLDSFQPSAVSLMPEGLDKTLGPAKTGDLLAFLLTPPPSMPPAPSDPVHAPPPPRSRDEIARTLEGSDGLPAEPAPLRILLVAGPKDHGPGEHDYPAWQRVWARLLSFANGVSVRTAWNWPSASDLEQSDLIVFFQQGAWTPERAAAIDAHLARGGGIAYLHYAVDGGKDPAGFAERIGLAWQGGRSKFRHGDVQLDFTPSAGHAAGHLIGRNFRELRLHDESYWDLVGDPGRVQVIATAIEDGAPRPLLWTREVGRGRVFVSILGHYSWTFDDPLFRILLLRAFAWCAHQPIDRLDDLVLPGAAQAPAAP